MSALIKILIGAMIGMGLISGFFLFKFPQEVILVKPETQKGVEQVLQNAFADLPNLPEPEAPTSTFLAEPSSNGDLGPQAQLANPPVVAKGLYVTGWIAGYKSRMQAIIKLLDQTELNAVVIDIKDYSGYVSYKMNVPEVKSAGADKQPRMAYPNRLIKDLHDHNVYVIGRVTVFEDSVLAKAHPEWALHRADGSLWADSKGLNWLDPASQNVWDYEVAIARDAFARGFDEINFDYVRFPSDGTLGAIKFPVYDGVLPKDRVIEKFFKYMRAALPDKKISADVFGLTTVAVDDLGIGQKIERTNGNFDYISPMVYPSHYSAGFQGFKNPAQYPYEVINYSMTTAATRLAKLNRGAPTSTEASSTPPRAPTKLRPWLQSFDLGAVYTPDMIRKEIRAADEVAKQHPELYAGWLLWDPNNVYSNYKE